MTIDSRSPYGLTFIRFNGDSHICVGTNRRDTIQRALTYWIEKHGTI